MCVVTSVTNMQYIILIIFTVKQFNSLIHNLSTSQLETMVTCDMMFWLMGTGQEAGAGGRCVCNTVLVYIPHNCACVITVYTLCDCPYLYYFRRRMQMNPHVYVLF